MKNYIYPKIEVTLTSLDVNSIPKERKAILQSLINYIQIKVQDKEDVRLNFICTHNSRRSHLSQAWTQVMAAYFGLPKVSVYSGGTETTAMYPVVGETLKKQGFEITHFPKASILCMPLNLQKIHIRLLGSQRNMTILLILLPVLQLS
jgi:arsenate reductase (thioredoxin)